MSSAPDANPVKSYYIQHVQSGAEFRCADLLEVNQWMTSRNHSYLAEMLAGSAAPDDTIQEDAQ